MIDQFNGTAEAVPCHAGRRTLAQPYQAGDRMLWPAAAFFSFRAAFLKGFAINRLSLQSRKRTRHRLRKPL